MGCILMGDRAERMVGGEGMTDTIRNKIPNRMDVVSEYSRAKSGEACFKGGIGGAAKKMMMSLVSRPATWISFERVIFDHCFSKPLSAERKNLVDEFELLRS